MWCICMYYNYCETKAQTPNKTKIYVSGNNDCAKDL